MGFTTRFSEQWAPVVRLDPISHGPSAAYLGWVQMALYRRIAIIVDVGVLGTLATVNAHVDQATDAAGTGAKLISGKTMTALTAAGTDDNKIVCFEVRAEELDLVNGYGYISLHFTTAVAASMAQVIYLADVARFRPVTTANWEEIID